PNYKIQFSKHVGEDYVKSAALQADGKIVAAGFMRDLVRYTPAGTLDTTFGSRGVAVYPQGGGSGVGPSNWYRTYALLIQADGSILVGGTIGGSAGYQHGALLRYTPGGTLDTSFGSGGEVVVPESGTQGSTSTRFISALALENGALVAGGWDSPPLGQPQ